ncbi:MAG: hypothetical protein LKE31_01320 [Bacilli bacterium]|jgi:hypothetical protein|nr:hypothetical protein [Bacilli bacterium]
MKKKKDQSTPKTGETLPTSPLTSLANDFKSLDEEEPLCQRKNDGTD